MSVGQLACDLPPSGEMPLGVGVRLSLCVCACASRRLCVALCGVRVYASHLPPLFAFHGVRRARRARGIYVNRPRYQ